MRKVDLRKLLTRLQKFFFVKLKKNYLSCIQYYFAGKTDNVFIFKISKPCFSIKKNVCFIIIYFRSFYLFKNLKYWCKKFINIQTQILIDIIVCVKATTFFH